MSVLPLRKIILTGQSVFPIFLEIHFNLLLENNPVFRTTNSLELKFKLNKSQVHKHTIWTFEARFHITWQRPYKYTCQFQLGVFVFGWKSNCSPNSNQHLESIIYTIWQYSLDLHAFFIFKEIHQLWNEKKTLWIALTFSISPSRIWWIFFKKIRFLRGDLMSF